MIDISLSINTSFAVVIWDLIGDLEIDIREGFFLEETYIDQAFGTLDLE